MYNAMLFSIILFYPFGRFGPVFGWRSFEMRVENLLFDLPQPKIFNLNITILEANNSQYFSGSLNLLQNVNHLFGHYEIRTDSGSGAYDMVYLNKTFDLCQLLKNYKANALFSIAYRIALNYDKYGLDKQCPLHKRFLQFSNVNIDANNFPPFLPEIKAVVSGVAWMQQHKVKTYLCRYSGTVIFQKTFQPNKTN